MLNWAERADRASIDRRTAPAPAKRIALALQGGGSHGAYTWGVLDAILADRRLHISAISGASAGALNAAVAAHGLALGGAEGARECLARFWSEVANIGEPFYGWEKLWSDGEPALRTISALSGILSPAQLNPLELDPLRHILARQIDFERLNEGTACKLFIAATEVTTGRLRVYRTHEIDVLVLLASACLPRLHLPVRLGEKSYWDGGLSANPPILPLLEHASAHDLLLVTLLPEAETVPTSSAGISQRLNDIAFSAGLQAELRWLAAMKNDAQEKWLVTGFPRRLKKLRLHHIDGGPRAGHLGGYSRLSTARSLLRSLHERGFLDAQEWLERHYEDVGHVSTASFG